MVLEPRLSIARNKLILLKREVNVKDTETSLTPRTRDDTESWNVRSSLFLSNSVASFTPILSPDWSMYHGLSVILLYFLTLYMAIGPIPH